MDLASVDLMLLASKAAAFCEITRNGGHWTTQGHSRSLISVVTESIISELSLCIGEIIAFDTGCHYLTPLFLGEPQNCGPQNWASKS